MGDSAASIMAEHGKSLVTQGTHDGDLVAGHRSLRIVDVLLAPVRTRGIAIAAQIARNHPIARLHQARSYLMPGYMGLWVPMQQEHRLALARTHAMDANALIRFQIEGLEALHQVLFQSHTVVFGLCAEAAKRLRFTHAVTARSLPPTWRYLLWRS